MSHDAPAIVLRGLQVSYGSHRAVDGVDLEIPRGEVFALLGPNGAGKTTTVEVMEGLRPRSGGEVLVLGQDPARADRRWRSRIGVVLQTAQDQPDARVREMLAQFASYYPDPRDVDEVLEVVGLTEKKDAALRDLSGGQRRRMDVALGIVGRPELLFLDEPTTGFDPEARRQFWQLIRDLAADGTTILLTTHYLDEAEQLADRIGVLANGRLVEVDTPERFGGRAEAGTVVTWQGPNGRERRETTNPAQLIEELSREFAGAVPDLQVHRPSLEETYLAMIGEAR
ncbi:ABC transporter ATP-binding protein [Kitasatospora sp. NPDC056181]|uniref:ABC transporter ATP-binding protein n=1 Tax=Kitasatospora sp. NPDC056181 TaxID=3345737 RepID=UPI0035D6A712